MNAISTLGIVASYSVIHTNFTGNIPFRLSKPLKSGSTKVLVISLALSGRKFMNMMESPAFIGSAPSIITGTTNSSVTPSAYESSIAFTAQHE